MDSPEALTRADLIARFANVPYALAQVVVLNADLAGIKVETLRGPCRKKELVAVRRIAVAQALRLGFGWSEIGRALKRDHSTIFNLARAV